MIHPDITTAYAPEPEEKQEPAKPVFVGELVELRQRCPELMRMLDRQTEAILAVPTLGVPGLLEQMSVGELMAYRAGQRSVYKFLAEYGKHG